MILACFVAALLVMVVMAALDVFWPLTVGVAAALSWHIWSHGFASLWALWRPQYIIAYIVIGLLWVCFRWMLLVERKLKQGGGPPLWERHSDDFIAYFFYWPLDVVAYTFSELIVDAWDAISAVFSDSFNRYAHWRFAKAQAKKS
jgi:hypothetical protein